MAVINITSPTLEAFQSAVNEAVDGDKLILCAGNFPFGLTEVNISKTISLIGQGYDKTTISTDLMVDYSTQPIHFTATIDIPMRISGIRFEGILDANNHNNLIQINGVCKQLRIDHCYFIHGGSHSMMIDGDIEGCIDHCIFYDDAVESISTRNGVNQDTIWTNQPVVGYSDGLTNKGIYIEDCEFYFLTRGTHAVTTVNGQRTIFRHNYIESSFNGALIDFHGNFENDRGTYSFEVYNNTIYCPSSVYISYGVYCRSGKGVIYNNTFQTLYANRLVYPVCLTNYRSWSVNYQHFANPDCVAHGLNANVHTYEDARLYDSVRDVYCWNNTYRNVNVIENVVVEVIDRGHDQLHIQENRDYYNYEMPNYVELPYPYYLNMDPVKDYPIDRVGVKTL